MCRYMRIGRKQGRWVKLWRNSYCKTFKLFLTLEIFQVMVVRYEVVWGGTCKTVLLQAYRSRNAVIAYYNLFYNVKLHTISPNYLHTATLNNSVRKWSRDMTPHKKIISTGSETVRTIIIRRVNFFFSVKQIRFLFKWEYSDCYQNITLCTAINNGFYYLTGSMQL